MGRRTGITAVSALGLLLGACALGPAAMSPPVPYEGSASPWDAARLAGATFRAVGNEPGWFAEVYPDSLVLVTAYGEERYAFGPYTTSAPDAEPFVYEASTGGHTLTLSLADAPCQDDMSGEPFDTTVTATFDGQTYQGCGRPLDDT